MEDILEIYPRPLGLMRYTRRWASPRRLEPRPYKPKPGQPTRSDNKKPYHTCDGYGKFTKQIPVLDPKTGEIISMKFEFIGGDNSGPYGRISITSNGKRDRFSAHDLATTIFYGKPKNPTLTADHRNRDRLDNHFSNLRWLSKRGQSLNQNPRQEYKFVLQLKSTLKFVCMWLTPEHAGKKLGIDPEIIRQSCDESAPQGEFVWQWDNGQDILGEEWKIAEYPDLEMREYYVSNFGRIRNRVGATFGSFKEYLYFGIATADGAYKNLAAHRMIMYTFRRDQYAPGLIVNHRDGIKTHNTVSNLQWTTHSGNTLHAHRTGLIDMSSVSNPVAKMHPDRDEIMQIFPSCAEAARSISIRAESITRVCNGKFKTTCGYRWAFLNNLDPALMTAYEAENSPVRSDPSIVSEPQSRVVFQVALKKDTILMKYESMSTAAKFIGPKAAHSLISIGVDHPIKTAYGYRWISPKNPNDDWQMLIAEYEAEGCPNRIDPNYVPEIQARTVFRVALGSDEILSMHSSMAKAAKSIRSDASCSGISRAIDNMTKSSLGFRWISSENPHWQEQMRDFRSPAASSV